MSLRLNYIILAQLMNRLPAREDRNRPAREIAELVVAVDAEVLIDRSKQVLRRQRPLLGELAAAVGGADHPGPCACLRATRLKVALWLAVSRSPNQVGVADACQRARNDKPQAASSE